MGPKKYIGIAILISDKLVFQLKMVMRQRWTAYNDYRTIHQKDLTLSKQRSIKTFKAITIKCENRPWEKHSYDGGLPADHFHQWTN